MTYKRACEARFCFRFSVTIYGGLVEAWPVSACIKNKVRFLPKSLSAPVHKAVQDS